MKYIILLFAIILFSSNCQSQVIREVLSPAQQNEADSLNVLIYQGIQGYWESYNGDSDYVLHFYGDSVTQLVIEDSKCVTYGKSNVEIMKTRTLIKSTFQLTGNGLIEYMVKGYNPDDTSVPGYYARSWGSAYFLNNTLRVSGSYVRLEGATSVYYKKVPDVKSMKQ